MHFQWLDCALAALQALDGSDFAQTAESVPQPYTESPPLTESLYDLPSVLVPPEIVEVDSLTTESGEDAQPKKEEWPQCYIRLFDDDVCRIRLCLSWLTVDIVAEHARPYNTSGLHAPLEHHRYC